MGLYVVFYKFVRLCSTDIDDDLVDILWRYSAIYAAELVQG